MINPVNGKDITDKKAAEYITTLREVRANARRKMRSGNPAIRAQAARVHVQVPPMIREVYVNDHAARYR